MITMTLALLVIRALWFIAPAYAANGFPPLLQGTHPLDGKRTWHGKRILGNGKTWEGTFGGILVGILIGGLQIMVQDDLAALGLQLPQLTLPLVVAMSIGTMVGDVLGSFIKRRIGIERGGAAPLLDQEGFLIMALLFGATVYSLDLALVAVLLIITPPIHWITNVIGYWLQVKKTPW